MTGDTTYFVQSNGAESVTVNHNTVQHGGNIVSGYGKPTIGFSFTNNIVQYNAYGIVCLSKAQRAQTVLSASVFRELQSRATLSPTMVTLAQRFKMFSAR